MALIVELGSGAADSESYASVAQADAYLANRGMTNWATLSTTEKEQALRRACDYIGQTYKSRFGGYRVSVTQALDFPRYSVPRSDGAASYYPSDSIPKELVNANIEMALRAAAGELLEDQDAPVIEETVGPITTRYAAGASQTKKFPAIDRLLAPFITGGDSGGFGSIRLVRA